jgi:GNAT superfamily N-acetyltransferase
MATVERLLTAGLVDLSPEPPETPAAREAIGAYFAELDERFDIGFDPAVSLPGDGDDFAPPRGVLLLARLSGRVVGCGAVRIDGGVADIKRMWVHPDARGLGLGSRILRALEAEASTAGATIARLETNRSLVEAIGMYRSHGYREVPAFNDEPYAQHWFEKPLEPSTPLPGG